MIYELCYLVGESKEQDLPRIKEEVSGIISKEGGKWLEPRIDEKRKMAYKVGKEVRGIYVAQRFEISKEESESDEIKNPIDSINRKMNLYKDVLRFIIIKADELPELKAREIREKVKKDFRKPAYFKKTEPVIARERKKEEIIEEKKDEIKTEKTEIKEPTPAETPKTEEKTGEKSIDEKIDEILNI
ncbi:MAG: 30S ribosomal protein S6 [Patescibacteria group bacterium]